MRSVARGALTGAGFGLAAGGVEGWFSARQIIASNMAPPVGLLVDAGLLAIAFGTVLGVIAAFVPGLSRHRVPHLIVVALAWAALELLAAPSSLARSNLPLVAPFEAFVLVCFGRAVGRRWPLLPPTIGISIVVSAILVPELHVSRRLPPPEPARHEAAPDAPDVVLVVLDTVRADHVSAYGYARATTPIFDTLARDGALFLDAVSPGTWSLPAHASLFTGRFVSAHGADCESPKLASDLPTLAGTLAADGYETRAFTANPWISDAVGLTRGFESSDEVWRSGDVERSFHFVYRLLDWLGLGAADKGGDRVARDFERWATTRPRGGAPAFAFLNFIEAHFPYHQVPGEFLARYSNLSRRGQRDLSMRVFAAQFGDAAPDPAEVGPSVSAMYDAGVSYSDHLLGRVVEVLRRRGTLDRTILVVVADHGELLGESDEYGHGFSLHEAVVHVPLLVRYPATIRPGMRVAQPVSTAAVFATITDLAHVVAPPSVQVGSLLPAIGGAPLDAPVISEQFATGLGSFSTVRDPLLERGMRYRAYQSGQWKVVETSVGAVHLFDLAADPGETHDLAGTQAARLAGLRTDLETWRVRLALPPLDRLLTVARVAAPDGGDRASLRTLGYVQ
jgi:arylsulfatase A-like enzyme